MGGVKLTDYGAASPQNGVFSKDDERSAELARRAQRGDYDDGKPAIFYAITVISRADSNSQISSSNN